MSEYEPRFRWYATETQRAANALPRWTKFRRERDSVGQQFINPACWHLDHLSDGLERYLRDRFLETTEVNMPDLMREVQLSTIVRLPRPTQIENWIQNSSFEIISSHDRLPDLWRSEGDGQVDVTSGLLGLRGIKLTVGSGQWAGVYYLSRESIKAGVQWTWYIWYQSSATGLTAPATGYGLEVIGYHADLTTETLRAAFLPDTKGMAQRAVVRGSFTQDVTHWKFRVIVTNSTPFPITTPVTVDLAMAREGDVIPGWKPSIFDTLPHLYLYDRLPPIVCEHPVRAQFVERLQDFWEEAIPTRAGTAQLLSSGGAIDPTPSADATGWTHHGGAGRFVEVDYYKKEWEGIYQLGYQDSSPKIRGLGVVAADVFGPYDLAFRNWRNWFEDGISWTPEAMSPFGQRLLVVLKKQDHLGNTKRYAAIVEPRLPRPFPTYMEALAVIELDGIPTSALITRASMRYGDQQHLYVGNGESEWAFDLYYDYFIVDFDGRILYFREDYGEVVPQLAVDVLEEDINLRPQ